MFGNSYWSSCPVLEAFDDISGMIKVENFEWRLGANGGILLSRCRGGVHWTPFRRRAATSQSYAYLTVYKTQSYTGSVMARDIISHLINLLKASSSKLSSLTELDLADPCSNSWKAHSSISFSETFPVGFLSILLLKFPYLSSEAGDLYEGEETENLSVFLMLNSFR